MKEFLFAQKAFIVSEDCLLMVQKSMDDPYQPGKWEVPGGRMDFGEDVDAHIQREVFEEVGLRVKPGKPFHVWQWAISRIGPTGESRESQIVAVARLCAAESRQVSTDHRVEGDFLGEMRWVPLDDIDQYDWIPNMVPVVRSFKQAAWSARKPS